MPQLLKLTLTLTFTSVNCPRPHNFPVSPPGSRSLSRRHPPRPPRGTSQAQAPSLVHREDAPEGWLGGGVPLAPALHESCVLLLAQVTACHLSFRALSSCSALHPPALLWWPPRGRARFGQGCARCRLPSCAGLSSASWVLGALWSVLLRCAGRVAAVS